MNLRKNKNINVSSYAICVFNEIGVTTNIVHLQNTSNSWTLQDCLPKHQLELKDELRSLKKLFPSALTWSKFKLTHFDFFSKVR